MQKMNSLDLSQVFELAKYPLIGRGAFGNIFFYEDKNKNQYAIKCLVEDEYDNSTTHIEEEINFSQTLMSLRPLHPGILQYYGSKIQDITMPDGDKRTDHLLFYEYANGNLLKLVQRFAPFSLQELKACFLEIFSTFLYLQLKGQAHRDIDPKNILFKYKNGSNINLRNNWNFKVCDFGLSKSISHASTAHFIEGKESYMGPEIYNSLKFSPERKAKYNVFKGDVYSLGLTILYMTMKKILKKDNKCKKELHDQELDELLDELKKQYGEGEKEVRLFAEMLRIMLAYNNKDRMDFIELYAFMVKTKFIEPIDEEVKNWISKSPVLLFPEILGKPFECLLKEKEKIEEERSKLEADIRVLVQANQKIDEELKKEREVRMRIQKEFDVLANLLNNTAQTTEKKLQKKASMPVSEMKQHDSPKSYNGFSMEFTTFREFEKRIIPEKIVTRLVLDFSEEDANLINKTILTILGVKLPRFKLLEELAISFGGKGIMNKGTFDLSTTLLSLSNLKRLSLDLSKSEFICNDGLFNLAASICQMQVQYLDIDISYHFIYSPETLKKFASLLSKCTSLFGLEMKFFGFCQHLSLPKQTFEDMTKELKQSLINLQHFVLEYN